MGIAPAAILHNLRCACRSRSFSKTQQALDTFLIEGTRYNNQGDGQVYVGMEEVKGYGEGTCKRICENRHKLRQRISYDHLILSQQIDYMGHHSWNIRLVLCDLLCTRIRALIPKVIHLSRLTYILV
jgi:hypothetical protein